MSCFIYAEEVGPIQREGHSSRELIDVQHGAVKGYKIGLTEYTTEEYLTPGVHDDQEGFYVIEGEGWAKVGEEEFQIRPGSAFIAPQGVPHAVKKNPGSVPVKLVWSHGAV